MVLRKSLGARVSWPDLAAVLGIPLTSQALPAQADCPRCGGGGTLHVYEDNIKGGGWHHCFACRTQGDFVELAAAVWELPLDVALMKLAQEGIPLSAADLGPERVDNYQKHRQRREAFDAFWGLCRQTLLRRQRSAGLNALRARFRLAWRGAEAAWPDSAAGRLLGAADRNAVEAVFNPFVANGTRARNDKRVLRGGGWAEVLLIPYHDLPDRLTGFFLVGRQGERRDMVWRHVPRAFPGRVNCLPEFGLAGLPLLADGGGGRPVVAVNDPLLLVRLHVRHALVNAEPLPLVAWHDGAGGKTLAAWKVLAGRRLVFWGWKLTVKTLLQAMATGGELCTVGPEEPARGASLDHYLRLHPAEDLYRRVLKWAKPWQEFLSHHITYTKSGWCAGLFLGLHRAGVDVHEVIKQLRPKAQRLIGDALTLPPAERSVLHGSGRVTERLSGWYYEATKAFQVSNLPAPTRITNFLLRVDKVVVRKGEPFLVGRLCFNQYQTVVPFDISQKQFERDTLFALRMACLVSGRHVNPELKDRSWGRRLLDISYAFQAPKVTEFED